MDYAQAVKKFRDNPSAQTLENAAAELCGGMSAGEKLKLLSGKKFFLRNGFDLITKGQKYNCRPCLAGGNKRLGIPEVAFSDGPRGVVMGNSTCFPVSMARGASFDDELEYEIGSAMADEVIAGGGNYFAGICINLLRNPRWGRAQETYGEDPFLLSKMGAALTKAVQDKGVIACPKHYAVNSIENIRFDVNVDCDEKTLHEVYLPHFKACVDAGAMSIMGAYNLFRGEHCCESRYLLKDILRDKWGFKGFTISDFLMGVRNAPKALKAGLDIEMPQKMRYASLPLCLRTGKITMDDIDNSVKSILRALIAVTPKIKPKDKSVIACKEHTSLAERAALEGTVLLKNSGILPLQNPKKIAVAGRYADKINVGDHGSSSVYAPYTVTPYKGLCNVYGKNRVVLCEGTSLTPKESEISACDAIIVCVGSDYRQEGENLANFSKSDKVQERGMGGDRYSLRIPADEVALIRHACAISKNVIVNIIGGSAYIIEEWKDSVQAILHSFYGGMEGGNALAKLISGAENPSGHLPFTMAVSEDDYPPFLFPGDKTRDIDYGFYHGYTLLDKEGKRAAFPFGFGLSYTSFAFQRVSAKAKEDCVEISLTVKNKGERGGKSVVQIYAGAPGERARKLLKGFKKVFVPAGESVKVLIRIDKNDLKFYNPDTGDYYLADCYDFYIGQDSEDAENKTFKINF